MIFLILYFSGTGNSRFAAQKIAEICHDELISINRISRQRIQDPFNAQYAFSSESPFVIVCPTYCWHIPRIVEDFLYESRFLGSTDLYFFLTCGSGTGAAAEHAAEICKKLEMRFMGLSSIRMPENYICLFRAPDADDAVGIIRASIAQIESVARQISTGRTISDSNAGRAMPVLLYNLFYRFFITDKKFYAKSSCIGCGLCASLCPTVNIVLRNKRPEWQGNCVQCQSCIGVCPVDAIEFGRRSRKKRRYYLYSDGRQKFPEERGGFSSESDS